MTIVAVAILAGGFGNFLVEQKRYSEAEVVLRECLEIVHKSRPAGGRIAVMLQGALGMALAGQGDVEEANRLIMGTWQKAKGTKGTDPKDRREFLGRVIAIYTEQGKPEEAAKYSALLPAEDTAPAPTP